MALGLGLYRTLSWVFITIWCSARTWIRMHSVLSWCFPADILSVRKFQGNPTVYWQQLAFFFLNNIYTHHKPVLWLTRLTLWPRFTLTLVIHPVELGSPFILAVNLKWRGDRSRCRGFQGMQNSVRNQNTKELEMNFKGSGSIAQTVLYTCVCLWRHTKLNYSVTYKKKKNRLWGRETRMKAQKSKNFIQQQMRRTAEDWKMDAGGGEWMMRE